MKALASKHRGFAFLTPSGQTLLEALGSLYLGGGVSHVLIWSGYDQLRQNQSGRQVAEELSKAAQNLRKYCETSVVIIMPPFIPVVQTEWREVRHQLNKMPSQANLTLLTPNCAQSKAFPQFIDDAGFPTESALQDVAAILKKTGLDLPEKQAPKPKRQSIQPPASAGDQAQWQPGPSNRPAHKLPSLLDLNVSKPEDPPGPPTRPSVLTRLSQIKLHATLMLLSILTLTTSAMDAPKPMVCHHQKGSSLLIRVPQGALCREIATPERSQYLPLDILRPNTKATEMTALYCLKTRSTATYYTNLLGDHFAQYVNSSEPTSPKECLEMRAREKCQYGRLSGHHTWQTNNRLKIDFPGRVSGFFTGSQTQSQANCAVTSTQIWHRPGEPGIFTAIGDGSQCDWMSGECVLPEGGALVWSKPSPDALCAFISQRGVQGGNLTGAIWQGTDSQLALSFTDPRQHGSAADRPSGSPSKAMPSTPRIPAVQEGPEQPTGQARSEPGRERTARQSAHGLTGQRDRGEATLFARRRLKDPYIQARWAGQDLLEVWPCIPVEWSSLRLRPSPPDTCYKFPPIYFDVEEAELEGFLDPAKLILTAGSQKLPCQYARLRVMNWAGGVVEIDQSTATSTPIPEWRMKQAVGAEEVPVLSPTVFRNLALSNVSDILPVHMVDAALQDLRSRLRSQQEQVNLEASAPYQTPAADSLWPWVYGWLLTLRDAWVYGCCTLVTLYFLWTLFLHQLASLLLLDPGRALAHRLQQLCWPARDQNSEELPAQLVPGKNNSTHITTTQATQYFWEAVDGHSRPYQKKRRRVLASSSNQPSPSQSLPPIQG
uniref:Uncharacterized protein n=1 Tax=Ditylenchus dipsaci TaxID=166011 RepID=A0A915CW18_9BILA